MSEEKQFIWKGKDLNTLGEIVDAMGRLESPEETKEFVAAFREVNQYAEKNFGYCTGYLDAETGARLREWSGCAHPVFGMAIRPDPQALFDAGGALASGEDPAKVRASFEIKEGNHHA